MGQVPVTMGKQVQAAGKILQASRQFSRSTKLCNKSSIRQVGVGAKNKVSVHERRYVVWSRFYQKKTLKCTNQICITGKALALTEERLKLLQKVDFCFDAREAKWLEKYEEFAAFVKVNGPGVFPQKGANPGLENWLRGQRKNYRLMMKGKSTGLTEKRKALLDKLGMQWET